MDEVRVGVRKKGEPPDPTKAFLLGSQEDGVRPDSPLEAPGSLREVEGEIHVYLSDMTHDAGEDES